MHGWSALTAHRKTEKSTNQKIRNEYLQSNQIYGSPKITKELQKQGIRVSQKL